MRSLAHSVEGGQLSLSSHIGRPGHPVRRPTEHAWRAGGAGIHRSALCRSTGLTPAQLRSLVMRLGHTLRRFQRERGLALFRPVAANSPLQSYCIDPDFATVATGATFSGDE